MQIFSKIITTAAIIITFSLTVCCCNPAPITPSSPEPKGDNITIARGTTGNIGNLSVGLSNTGKSDYINSNGLKQDGLIASLFLFDKIDNSETSMTVYLGQSFEFHNYSFYVKEIKATHLYFWDSPGATGGGLIWLVVSTK